MLTDTQKAVTVLGAEVAPVSAVQVLRRYPRLVAHLICESLGYHSPRSAAGQIAAHINGKPYFSERSGSLCGYLAKPMIAKLGRLLDDEEYHAVLVEWNRDDLERTCARHHHHKGFMADYLTARHMVEHVRQGGEEPNMGLMSW